MPTVVSISDVPLAEADAADGGADTEPLAEAEAVEFIDAVWKNAARELEDAADDATDEDDGATH